MLLVVTGYLVAAVAGLLISIGFLLWMPARWLDPQGPHAHRARRISGATLLILGIVLAIPGVPGPGVLLVALGMILLGISGSDADWHRLGRARGWLDAINRIRARAGRPPLGRHSGTPLA